MVKTRIRAFVLSGIVMLMLGAPVSAQTVGQISGVASIPGKGTLAGVTAQLRDLTTKQLVGVIKTNASGQFVFVVDQPGTFIVEILENDAVVGTTAPIVLSPGAMIVSAIAVSPTAGGAAAAAAAGGAAAGPAEPGAGQGSTGAAGAMAGGGVSGNIFMPTLPSVSSSATGSGVAAGTVPNRPTASPSR